MQALDIGDVAVQALDIGAVAVDANAGGPIIRFSEALGTLVRCSFAGRWLRHWRRGQQGQGMISWEIYLNSFKLNCQFTTFK